MTRERWQSAAENAFLVLAPVVAGYLSARATAYAIRSIFGLGDVPLLVMSGCVVGTIVGGALFFVIEAKINETRQKHGRLRIAHRRAWGRKYL